MAKQSNVNLTPATGATALYNLMEFLRVDLGFTVTRSGDGNSAFDDTGVDVFTAADATGANGMANTNAWYVVQDPGGEYEWCFQRGSNNTTWEVIVSAFDGFTGGSATVRATATDEGVIHDGILFAADGTYIWHLVGYDVAEVGVYPWYAYATEVSTGDCESFVAHDSLDPDSYPVLVGTRASPTSGEPDPSIYIAGYSTGGAAFQLISASPGWQTPTNSALDAWHGMNGPNGMTEAFVNIRACSYDMSADDFAPADSASGDGTGVDQRDGTDPMLPVLYGRATGELTSLGPKGFSAHIRLKCVDREYPDTLDIGGVRYVYASDLLLPFENSTTPAV